MHFLVSHSTLFKVKIGVRIPKNGTNVNPVR